MIRSIAKILIQRALDDADPRSTDDPLAIWLRRWVQRDVELERFERQLRRLEKSLADGASQHVSRSHLVAPNTQNQLPQTGFGASHFSTSLRPWAILALAASALIVVFVSSRFFAQPTSVSTQQITKSKPVPQDDSKTTKYQEWMKNSIAAGQRIHSKVRSKQVQASTSYAAMNHAVVEDIHLLESASKTGIRFVGQKIPAATIRMLGMNK